MPVRLPMKRVLWRDCKNLKHLASHTVLCYSTCQIANAGKSSYVCDLSDVLWKFELIVPSSICIYIFKSIGISVRNYHIAISNVGSLILSPSFCIQLHETSYTSTELVEVLFTRSILLVFGCALKIAMIVVYVEFELNNHWT